MTESRPGTRRTAAVPGPFWWHDTVGYATYLRSFADSDDDGVGDLGGMTARLDHLAELGIGLLWITPFYPSPGADNGYDVADYCAIDPRYGDEQALRRLLERAHELGIRVVIDLVPNHTSDRHPWFRAALRGPDDPHHGYYLWAPPGADGGVPNNWVSCFGGSVWTWVPELGRYYLHLFLEEQPDLDWRNPAVAAEFDAILRHWLDLGVDGFRIDVAQGLVKDAALRSNPQLAPWDPTSERNEQWAAFEHRHDIVQPETLDVFRRWHGLCVEHDAMLLGETYVLDPARYASLLPGDGLDLGCWFGLMAAPWEPGALRDAIAGPLAAVSDRRRIAWAVSSLDEVRAPTRFGGGDEGRRRALALNTLLFCLPGVPFLYQGEELGLVEGVVDTHERTDPVGGEHGTGRDGCRTPLPWSPGPNFGFSGAARTWLPDGGRSDADTAAVQAASAGSWLARYRDLVALRRAHAELRQDGPLEWPEGFPPQLLVVRRGPWTVLLNAGDEAATITSRGRIVFDSDHGMLALTDPTPPTGDPSSSGGRAVTVVPGQAVVLHDDGGDRAGPP